MIKSTISLTRKGTRWAVVEGKVVLATFATKREARKFLREARAAERAAAAFLKGIEATGRSLCDIRCTSATGNLCSCQCIGANHGADAL